MNIIFSKQDTWLSRLIRYGTDSDSSHASIRFDGDEANWMVQSNAHGVQPGWWNYFLKKSTVMHTFKIVNIDEVALEKAVDDCLDEVIGKGYDFFSVFGLFLEVFFKKVFRLKIKNIFGSSKLFFCSEFVLKVSKVIEKELGKKIYDGKFEETLPADLLKQSYGNEFLEEVR